MGVSMEEWWGPCQGRRPVCVDEKPVSSHLSVDVDPPQDQGVMRLVSRAVRLFCQAVGHGHLPARLSLQPPRWQRVSVLAIV